MELDTYSLAKAGFSEEETHEISRCEDEKKQIRILRKCRYRLLDEIHEKQQSLDKIDYMIIKMKEHL